PLIDAVPRSLIQASLGASTANWLWLTPIAQERASYSPLIVLTALLIAVGTFIFIHYRTGGKRRTAPWSCGHPHLNSRMQYTAASFSQPLRRIFADVYRPRDKLLRTDLGHPLLVKKLRYQVHVRDLSWGYLYLPIRQLSEWLTRRTDWLHRRPIHGYLAFTFVTLLILLGLLL
ncbi:MAG: hydrogenase 4 subunit B, partial [Gammaproteobacteria bacterium]